MLNWLNRATDPNSVAVVPDLITMLEADLNSDPRVRRLVNEGDFVISAEDVSLPAATKQIVSWRHDGPLYYGPLEDVDINSLSVVKAGSPTGIPSHYSIVGPLVARVAPAPATGETYTTQLQYWQGVPALSANSTNWLLTNYPHIYLYGTMLQAQPWIKHDERLPLFEAKYEAALEKLHLDIERGRWGSHLVRQTESLDFYVP